MCDERDPNYYHVWVDFLAVLAETDKSIHIKYTDTLNLWIPKSICRSACDEGAYVHEDIFNSIKKEAKASLHVPKSFKTPRIF